MNQSDIQMKLQDIFEDEENSKELKYIGVTLNQYSKNRLFEYVKEHKIPNPLDPSEYHITVMYSSTSILGYKADTTLRNKKIAPEGFDIFKGQDGNDCLVLRVHSDYLDERHKKALIAGGTYTFDKYRPHITLSYNRQGFDYKSLNPKDIGDLFIEHEFIEPIDLEYAKSLAAA